MHACEIAIIYNFVALYTKYIFRLKTVSLFYT